MIDRVVLPPLDQPKQMRELQRDQARVLDQGAQARREAPDIRHMREDIVRGHQVGPPVLGRRSPGPVSAPRNWTSVADALGAGRLGHVRGRLDAKHRDVPRP